MNNSTSITSQFHDSKIGAAIADLKSGSKNRQTTSFRQRCELIKSCLASVAECSREWVSAACEAKQIQPHQSAVAEEILAGPACLMRYLQLLAITGHDWETTGHPRLPGVARKNTRGVDCIPILPVDKLSDRLCFRGLHAEVWLRPDSNPDEIFASPMSAQPEARIGLVLGAGNVSAIPATDMLYKVFQDSEAVLLKLNPVNEYLAPIFERAFQPLIQNDLLRLILGGSETGHALVHHDDVDTIHITGSHHTHDSIVWGDRPADANSRRESAIPLLTKPISSELGNVTPWIVVPGNYTRKELESQAEHIVASIVNNASFNCLATKVIVTSKQWSQRAQFLELVESHLASVPPRYAYYPGARERFERTTGNTPPAGQDGTLPWTLLRDKSPADSPQLFEQESFVCVCAETTLDVSSAAAFLTQAVDFVNEALFGTLCASVTIPREFRNQNAEELDAAIEGLRYGTVCINQWSGVSYGLMTPPWGGHADSENARIQSGLGHVHNTFSLKNFDKSVLWGPLAPWPKPVWFPSHRTSVQTAWALTRYYQAPSWLRIPSLFCNALMG